MITNKTTKTSQVEIEVHVVINIESYWIHIWS